MLSPFTAFVSGKRKGREDRPPSLNAQGPERKISIDKERMGVNMARNSSRCGKK
jgi:hypothetical protein